MESLFTFKCYDIDYARLLEKWLFSGNACHSISLSSEKVAVQYKYPFEKGLTLNN